MRNGWFEAPRGGRSPGIRKPLSVPCLDLEIPRVLRVNHNTLAAPKLIAPKMERRFIGLFSECHRGSRGSGSEGKNKKEALHYEFGSR